MSDEIFKDEFSDGFIVSSWITSKWGKELQKLWNDYDPIGVFQGEHDSEWPDDEYDSYHNIIIKHLNKGSSHEWIFKAVKHTVTINIGLSWNERLEKRTNEFVENVLHWFATKKPELNK